MSTPLIKLDNCQVHYLQKQFNIEILPGQLTLFTGGNGSGKTTLIKLVLGLLNPSKGKVIVPKQFSKAYLPEICELPPYMKTLSYLELISKIKKKSLNLKLIEEFNVPLDIDLAHLSKGNRQKVGIITSLMGSEELICMDEPLSGLDEKACLTLRNEIKRKMLESVSILICTHQKSLFNNILHQEINL